MLTRKEVESILRELRGVPRLMASLMYGTGPRVLECARLRVKDLDFSRHELTVRDGKGRKDRVTMLPATLVQPLQRHLEQVRQQHAREIWPREREASPCLKRSVASTLERRGSGPGSGSSPLTWDQGKEMAEHVRFSTDTNMVVYFCDPHSPWQRGSNENTNGLLRQHFPSKADLSLHSAAHLDLPPI